MPAFSAAETFGGESLTSPSSRNQPTIFCWMSYSVVAVPPAMRPRDFVECAVFYPVQLVGGRAMRLDGPIVPDGGEPLNKVAGGHDLDARLLHELDRAGVHARDIRDRAVRRVFHRHAPQSRQADG